MSIAKDHVGKFRVTIQRTHLPGGPNAGKKETIIKYFSQEDTARDFQLKARRHATCLMGHPIKDVPYVEHILAAN